MWQISLRKEDGRVATEVIRIHERDRELQLTRRWTVYDDMYSHLLQSRWKKVRENLRGFQRVVVN